MQKIVFATNNKNKVKEVKAILKDIVIISSLEDVGIFQELPEEYETLEENAKQKAEFVYNKTGLPAFADDTGLEVDILKGLPGVYSARYAGEEKDSLKNMEKLLIELNGKVNRAAQFRSVISYVAQNHDKVFEGIVKGTIIEKIRGNKGFGYDPLFVPSGYNKTFAELSSDIKNSISHRAIAVNKFINYIQNTYK